MYRYMIKVDSGKNSKIMIGTWIAISILTFMFQLILGTSPIFSTISLIIFLLAPLVVWVNGGASSMASLIFIATFGKLFFVSQWLKIFLGQAADTYLLAPVETVMTLAMGVVAFLIAGAAIRLVFGRTAGALRLPQDPGFLFWLAMVSIIITCFAIVTRHLIGLSRAGVGEYEDGQGLLLLMYISVLMPLAVSALTARCVIRTQGRYFIDGWVLLALLLTMAQGLWENARTTMFSGFVAFAVTYFAYGGRLRFKHVFSVLVTASLMQLFLFPLIDLQRGIDRGLGVGGFLQETMSIMSNLLDSNARVLDEGRLEDMYYGWDTRLYYGQPLGFLDRFAPNAVGEVVDYVQGVGTFGSENALDQLLYSIPNVILIPLGVERPLRGGAVLEGRILGSQSYMNYGIFAETYAYFGSFWFIPINALILFIYLGVLRLIYGNGLRSYMVPFGFSTLYFTYCNSDLADLGPQLTIQAPLNLLIVLAVLIGGSLVKRQKATVPHLA